MTKVNMLVIGVILSASFLMKLAGALNQTSVSLLTCDFEDKDPLCGFTQDATDNFDWTRHSGFTPSTSTGPSTDHTYGQQLGHYMYTESSSPRLHGDKARLISPHFVENTTLCLKFYYNMYGTDIGSLNVFAKSTGKRSAPVMTIKGNQHNEWKAGLVTIPSSTATGGFEIVFEGVIGPGYHGDIAIDDVSLLREPCQNSRVPFKTCGFENQDPMCGFTQDTTDDFDWIRNKGFTPSSGTGPSWDHTYGQEHSVQGYYIYTESSSPVRPGDKARLISPLFVGNSTLCLRFYYNMYGLEMGTINVYTKAHTGGNNNSPILSMTGNHGNVWKLAHVSIPVSTAKDGFEIVFEGIIGSSYHSDMAIDDVSLLTGQCDSVDGGNIVGR